MGASVLQAAWAHGLTSSQHAALLCCLACISISWLPATLQPECMHGILTLSIHRDLGTWGTAEKAVRICLLVLHAAAYTGI